MMWHPASRGLQALTQAELVNHILEVHHSFLRKQLQKIRVLLDSLIEENGPTEPRIQAARSVFQDFARAMQMSLEREELVVFPRLTEPPPFPPTCPLDNLIKAIEAGHREASYDLKYIQNQLEVQSLTLPLTTTHVALLETLDELERDLELHHYCEHEILFQRALNSDALDLSQ